VEALLNDEIKGQVKEAFGQLNNPVEVLFFGSQDGCEFCEQTKQLAEEVAALSGNLQLSVYDVESDEELASMYNVDKTPGLVITGRDGDKLIDFGVRYAGVPAGHEFSSLIQDIILVSGRDSGLSQQTRAMLADLTEPVSLQVFVTPTCPYCPRAVILAHQMALESPVVFQSYSLHDPGAYPAEPLSGQITWRVTQPWTEPYNEAEREALDKAKELIETLRKRSSNKTSPDE
jgi:glutaredoxin-like protein